MQIVEKNVGELVEYENNPRNNDNAVNAVAHSIQEFGFKVPVVIDKNNIIVAGHTRVKAAKQLGLEVVPCIVADDLTEEQIKAFRLVDNKTAELASWDFAKLTLELEGIGNIDMTDFGFENFDLDFGTNASVDNEEGRKNTLRDRFAYPPFSILDTTKADWLRRKKAWYDFGVRSAEGREGLKTGSSSPVGAVPGYYKLKEKKERELGIKLSNDEFKEKYLPNMLGNTQLRANNSGGSISIFDPVLCELMYYWFSTNGGAVLDPFAGGSVRGIVASMLGRQYTGVDLRREQVEANEKQARELCTKNKPTYFCGDSMGIDNIAKGEYDFVFSCPPYFNLEKYSDDPKDLSNMDYEKFIDCYRGIIKKCVSMLKEDRFACFVVGDVRNGKTGAYRNFHYETVKAFIDAGMIFYNDIVLVNSVGSLPVRVGAAFQNNRKVGKRHQNVLVFYKGNPKHIKDNFGVVEIAELPQEDVAEK